MTNSDRLQEIRERAESEAAIDLDPLECEEDRIYLLHLVTEQQREIERLKREVKDLKLAAKDLIPDTRGLPSW